MPADIPDGNIQEISHINLPVVIEGDSDASVRQRWQRGGRHLLNTRTLR